MIANSIARRRLPGVPRPRIMSLLLLGVLMICGSVRADEPGNAGMEPAPDVPILNLDLSFGLNLSALANMQEEAAAEGAGEEEEFKDETGTDPPRGK